MKELLVIIVTYNAMKWIDTCIRSVLSSSFHADIFIVDNGSKDGTIRHIKEKYTQVIFKQSTTNLGFGKANNIGLQYAIDNGYEYTYLLNQDAWVMEETFRTLIDVAKKYPQYGILSPLQVQANMHKLDFNFAAGALCYESCPHFFNDIIGGKLNEVYNVKNVMAAHWLMSRECLLKVGGFSPSFPHYGEDDNYTERVAYYGMKVGIAIKAIGIHDRENRTTSIKKRMYFDYIEAIKYFSSPLKQMSKNKHKSIKILLLDAVKYFSFTPLKYITILFLKMKYIKENREISKTRKAAFLKYEKNYNMNDL